MEGGNYAYDPDGDVTDVEDLSLLTTILSPDGALLSTMRDTSAATALASRYAALIQAEYPNLLAGNRPRAADPFRPLDAARCSKNSRMKPGTNAYAATATACRICRIARECADEPGDDDHSGFASAVLLGRGEEGHGHQRNA